MLWRKRRGENVTLVDVMQETGKPHFQPRPRHHEPLSGRQKMNV